MGIGYDYILGKLRVEDTGGVGPPGPPPTQANVLAALEYYDEDIANTPAILPSASGPFSVALGDGALSSGNYSIVTGGLDNTASNTYTAIGGGFGNVASGVASTICGGQQNSVTATNSVICGGNTNVCTTAQSAICGGQTNSVTVGIGRSFVGAGLNNETESADTFIGAGQNNEIENLAENSAILIGTNNTISSGSIGCVILSGTSCEVNPSTSYCLVSGKEATAHTSGMRVHAIGSFVSAGDQQVADIILNGTTVDDTPTDLSTGIVINTNITMPFELHVTARRTAGSATIGDSMYRIVRGCVKDVGGVLTFVGNLSCDNQFEDVAASSWVVSLSASAGKLQVVVVGEIGETIHWMCQAKIMEIG